MKVRVLKVSHLKALSLMCLKNKIMRFIYLLSLKRYLFTYFPLKLVTNRVYCLREKKSCNSMTTSLQLDEFRSSRFLRVLYQISLNLNHSLMI